MKRFLVFMFETYYPDGGAIDFKGSIDTTEELRNLINERFTEYESYDYINFLDTKTGEKILDNENNFILDYTDNGFIKEYVDNVCNTIQKILDDEKKEVK